MPDQKSHVRTELYRLLLDEETGVACYLIPRMLADPDSLTPEIPLAHPLSRPWHRISSFP